MEENVKKPTKFVDNIAYKNKFQFQLWINENIILQRYFKINGFVEESIYSAEFTHCMNDIVSRIQADLKSKSNIFTYYTNEKEPLKMNGFVKDPQERGYSDVCALTNPNVQGTVVLSDNTLINKEYLEYPEGVVNDYGDTERPADGEFIFKFSFLIDDVPVFEKIWDGNIYPKYVRNSVDLTNYMAQREDGFESNNFTQNFVYSLQRGKTNLINAFISDICDTLSNTYADNYEYTKETEEYKNVPLDKETFDFACSYYGGPIMLEKTGHIDIEDTPRKYNYYSAVKNYEKEWKKAVSKKTAEYRNFLYVR